MFIYLGIYIGMYVCVYIYTYIQVCVHVCITVIKEKEVMILKKSKVGYMEWFGGTKMGVGVSFYYNLKKF